MKAISFSLLILFSTIGAGYGLGAVGEDDPALAAPIAPKADMYETTDMVPLTMSPLKNDKRPDACEPDLRIVSQPDYGWVINNNDGTLSYIPQEGKEGLTSFKYELCCGENCASALINLDVSKEARCQFSHWEAPDFISPNGDGVNDVFQFAVLSNCWQNAVYRFSVFNTEGEMIYQDTDYRAEEAWLGVRNVKGTGIVSAGTYLYVLEQTGGRQKQKTTGYVEVK